MKCVGVLPLRVVLAAIGLSSMAAAPAVVIAAPDRDTASLLELVGAGALVALPLGVGGFWFLAKGLEYLRIGDGGVEIRSPLWRNQRWTWGEIRSVELDGGPFTVFPTITTQHGVARLRAGQSFVETPGSAAGRAMSAISARVERKPDAWQTSN